MFDLATASCQCEDPCGDQAGSRGAWDGEVHAMEGPSAWWAICNFQCFFAEVYAKVPKSAGFKFVMKLMIYIIYDILAFCRVCWTPLKKRAHSESVFQIREQRFAWLVPLAHQLAKRFGHLRACNEVLRCGKAMISERNETFASKAPSFGCKGKEAVAKHFMIFPGHCDTDWNKIARLADKWVLCM